MRPKTTLLQLTSLVSLTACLVSAQDSGNSQVPVFWKYLDPGPYTVGFQSFWIRDWSRTWRIAVPPGDASPVPARPVRINIWYPSQVVRTPSLRFKDYFGSARTPGFEYEEALIRDEDLGQKGDRGARNEYTSDSSFEKLMNVRMAAHRDARPRKGLFPIVVYSLGQGDLTQENVPLWEYLASRGLIVVSVPGLGTSPRREIMFIHDWPSYDNQVKDLAFALATVVRTMPSADSTRIAAVGHSMGGIYSLLLALRHSGIHTVVGLDPSYLGGQSSYAFKYETAPEFDPANFRGTLLTLYRGDNVARTHTVDSLYYARQRFVRVPGTAHADFNGTPLYTSLGPASEIDSTLVATRTQAAAVQSYAAVTRYIGCYLDQSLARNRATIECPQIPDAVGEDIAPSPGPTEEELYEIFRARGRPAAFVIFRGQIAAGSARLRPKVMARIINELSYAGRDVEAAGFAQLTAEIFASADAYERAGDEWANLNKVTEAVAAYDRALAIEPGRSSVSDKRKKLIGPVLK